MIKSGERNDFFVSRKKWNNKKKKQMESVVFTQIKDSDIDTNEIDYMSNGNISRIRIPALLYVHSLKADTDNVFVEMSRRRDYSRYFSKEYREQVGAHVFVNPEGMVCVLKAFFNKEEKFEISDAKPICEVYPCFTKSSNELCLGLRYTKNTKEGVRSFGRKCDDQNTSGGVFDVTEDFLDPKTIRNGIDRKLFPKEDQHFIIYVCAGAKLVVEDDRNDVLVKPMASSRRRNHDRALFQQGSAVIVSANLHLELPVRNKNTGASKLSRNQTYIWKDVDTHGILKPEEDLFQYWFTHRGLHQVNEQIIFLGANHSEHNSICWRLRIESPKGERTSVNAYLVAPEGAKIIDIQPWNWGLAEIYWRHRYERLYEKVLFPNNPSAYVQKECFKYQIPKLSGNNPYYWSKKIIGIGVNYNSWAVKYNYKHSEQSLSEMPRYHERQISRTDFSQPPYPEPLYPSVHCKNENLYKYLPHKTRPKHMADDMADIGGQVYKRLFKNEEEEYDWTDPKRVSLHPNKEFSSDYRLALDLMVYTKGKQSIGKKKCYYYELNAKEDMFESGSEIKSKSSEKMFQESLRSKSMDSDEGKAITTEDIEKPTEVKEPEEEKPKESFEEPIKDVSGLQSNEETGEPPKQEPEIQSEEGSEEQSKQVLRIPSKEDLGEQLKPDDQPKEQIEDKSESLPTTPPKDEELDKQDKHESGNQSNHQYRKKGKPKTPSSERLNDNKPKDGLEDNN